MRKSSLILLLAMAFVLTTVAAGFSSDDGGIITEPCVQAKCTKHAKVPWVYGQQIQLKKCAPTQNTQCPCPIFDYELGSIENGGYCSTHDVQGIIFKLCDCDKIDEFSTAKSYAIRLTIMEPAGGVYWTNSNVARTHPKDVANCYTDATNVECGSKPLAGDKIRVGSFRDPALTGGDYCLDPCDPSATKIALDYYSMTLGQTLFDTTNNTSDCCFTCGNNRVTTVQTCYTDLMKNLQSILLIDIPTLVYDPNEADVKLGVAVKIKVEIVEMPGKDDICEGGCKIMCDCLVEIGQFSECFNGQCHLCLPYMALGEGWWTGLALTNSTISNNKVTITFFADGQTASKDITVDALSVDALNIGDILAELNLPTDKPMYAKIVSDGALQGYVTIGYGLELAQGYLAPYGDSHGRCGCGTCGGK
jgi:hypothetical protein